MGKPTLQCVRIEHFVWLVRFVWWHLWSSTVLLLWPHLSATWEVVSKMLLTVLWTRSMDSMDFIVHVMVGSVWQGLRIFKHIRLPSGYYTSNCVQGGATKDAQWRWEGMMSFWTIPWASAGSTTAISSCCSNTTQQCFTEVSALPMLLLRLLRQWYNIV